MKRRGGQVCSHGVADDVLKNVPPNSTMLSILNSNILITSFSV